MRQAERRAAGHVRVSKVRGRAGDSFPSRMFSGRGGGHRESCPVPTAFSSSARNAERDEPAGGDAAEQVLAVLAGADEHDEQLLLAADRVAGERRELQSRPAVRASRLLVRDRELAVRHRGHVDERALDRAAARRHVEASADRAGAEGERARAGLGLAIERRAGGETPATGTVPPVFEQPFETGGVGFVAAVMTAVGTEDAKTLPSAFFACTLNRRVFPTSTFLSV